MAEKYWFRARKHGIGWVASTWQGYVVLVMYIIALVYSFFQVDTASHSVSDTLYAYVPRVIILTTLFIVITYLKGEPTSWRKSETKLPPEK